MVIQFLTSHWLDLLTTILGLAYILLEYRASVWLWVVGFLMQSLGIVLYYQKGLYADCGMEFYYLVLTIYGFWNWVRKPSGGTEHAPRVLPVTHFPVRYAVIWFVVTLLIWCGIYGILVTFTDSNVPLADSFNTALSFVGIWALARKYLEQWLIWIVVDVVTCALYIYKDIPFKAGLYGLYVIIAILGYRKWKKMMQLSDNECS